VWTNFAELNGKPGIDDDGNGYIDDIHGWDAFDNDGDPMDENAHGTHVAGTIGAEGNNGIGVVGVNHEISIVGCRFLGPTGSGTTAGAIGCLDYMLAVKEINGLNVKVTNNSWGGGPHSQALEDAIIKHNEAGILFVSAAGNNGSDNDKNDYYPANYNVPNVMSIASTTNKDNKSGFSQYGLSTVDMGAPGSDIASTGLGNAYIWMSGTSMASPQVSGAAALLASVDESISIADMKNILMTTGDSIAGLAGKTVSGKRLNVANAVLEANPVTGYKLAADARFMTVVAGESAAFTLTSVAKLGWGGTITFGATGELSASFEPETITAGQSTSVNIPTADDTAFGYYNVVVAGNTGEQLDNEGNPI